ncbi:LuxR C-terminal-related transcriptional regulator [Streptomyces sp. CAI-155]|uniref:helix-turn-helix transcriptional regulator n=1 Tax=Streptomyces sp. CAI-155 TaxID=1472660 RepID=UPI0015874D96|nr:LuxR C-terminal-related transcriptional regulator [Streptomyces sp. CAI-155]NUV81372.1 helix-turn-helix transcriptional regulator [Streptomyces sp. CAI-155]
MGSSEGRLGHSPHRNDVLCDTALRLYERSLRAGRIARAELTDAPCLTELPLLHPDPWDDAWMRPVPASAALANILQPVSREIDERLRLATALSRSLFPLTAVAHDDPNLAITVLEGVPAIQASLDEATATAADEILTAQPGSDRPAGSLRAALSNARVTAVQGTIARLLAEGHVDDVVACKMGISVRTCRSHIAKLMQTLGATSRTHLGAPLVHSGIAEAGHGGV